ncbi:MAG TPA: hypothetical protein VGK59_10935 [Ohtaekwangia sp.]
MIEVDKYVLPDVIPQHELQAWRSKIDKVELENCPPEVKRFIKVLAAKLGDFGRIGQYIEYIPGDDLLLSGMKQVDGKKINPWMHYPTPVPKMVACDHETAMLRIFKRKGKQGLIDWCKVKVDKTELAATLDLLHVEVFKIYRPEFLEMLAQLEAQKKLESDLKL